jgi:hypothetical protein
VVGSKTQHEHPIFHDLLELTLKNDGWSFRNYLGNL